MGTNYYIINVDKLEVLSPYRIKCGRVPNEQATWWLLSEDTDFGGTSYGGRWAGDRIRYVSEHRVETLNYDDPNSKLQIYWGEGFDHHGSSTEISREVAAEMNECGWPVELYDD